MIKKQFPLLIALLVLLAIVAFLVSKNSKSTFSKKDVSFSVTDTSQITRIVLRNDSDTLVLTRQIADWRFNNGFKARKKVVIALFEALSGIEVKSAVAKGENKKILEGFKKNVTEVQLFSNSKLLKNFKLQVNPVDISSVYILAQGSDKPFIAEIPGYTGNVYSLFRINEHYWRDKVLFNYSTDEILYISVELAENNAKSYRIFNYGNNKFSVKPLKSDNNLTNVNPQNLEIYLNSFKNIEVNNYIKSEKLLQLLQTSNPNYHLIVKDIHGNETSVKSYPIKLKQPDKKTGNMFDVNYCYVLLNNNEMAIAKYVVFDAILKDITYFTLK